MNELTKLILEDMKPALGVTEPGAIAFAVARAKAETKGSVRWVDVALNSGMYKNAYTCGIPGSDAYGNLHAAALGAVAADPEKGLESLDGITAEDNAAAKALLDAGKVSVTLDHMGSEITIDAQVQTETDTCSVHIRGGHTEIRWIEKNGKIFWGSKEESIHTAGEDAPAKIHQYTLHQILEYIETVPMDEIAFIRDAYTMNLELLEEGLHSEKTTIGPMLFQKNGGTLYSQDVKDTAQLLCNGAIEARVLGLSKPAMSITGSGAHGIIATMPLYACAKVKACREEILLRGTALSYLVTMYIKEYSGRLSAFCGCGIAAGTGMACGLGYLQGASEAQQEMIIQNMASGLTGMICDGGNQGCAMKGIVAVDAAFRSVDMALQNVCIDRIHGINGCTPEATMENMGKIASPGMVKTEEVIVEIMQKK